MAKSGHIPKHTIAIQQQKILSKVYIYSEVSICTSSRIMLNMYKLTDLLIKTEHLESVRKTEIND
jgi:hypothetical protein